MLQIVIIKYYHDKKQKTSKKLILPVGSLERISFINIINQFMSDTKKKVGLFRKFLHLG